MGGQVPTPAWFETPPVFSKRNARGPKPNGERSNCYYPCWVWWSGVVDEYLMVCLHIALWYGTPWRVHNTWITVSAPPAQQLESTVVIEEVEESEVEESEVEESEEEEYTFV